MAHPIVAAPFNPSISEPAHVRRGPGQRVSPFLEAQTVKPKKHPHRTSNLELRYVDRDERLLLDDLRGLPDPLQRLLIEDIRRGIRVWRRTRRERNAQNRGFRKQFTEWMRPQRRTRKGKGA